MSDLRLGYITYGLDRPAFGISRAVLNLGYELQRHSGVHPIFLTSYRSGAFVNSSANWVHLPGARLAPGLMTLGALELPIIARRWHLQVVHDPTGICPFMGRRGDGAFKRVVTVNDVTPLTHPETHTRLSRFLYRVYLPATLKYVDAVLCPSEATRQQITRYLRRPAKTIHVVPLAVDPHFHKVDASAYKPALEQLGLKQPFVLYVGALEPRKNLKTLLRAFKLLHSEHPDLQLVLAGGQRWKSAELPRAIEQLHLVDSVRFTGYLTDAALRALYSAASAFCFPSLAEGFGLPVLEAMACGTPVICSNASSLPEVAGQDALLVEPLDHTALARAVESVLRQPALARELGDRGMQRAAQFSWRRTCEGTVAVYRQVLGID